MAITRRSFIGTSTAAVAAGTLGRFAWPEFGGHVGTGFSLSAHAQAAQQPAPVTPVFQKIRGDAGYWTARGGTIGWLINSAGVIAVDSQFPDTAALCVEQLLKESGRTEIAALINTHHHGDHTGGNGVFRPKTKAIVAHANVPKYMASGWKQAMDRRAQQNPPPTTPPPAEPVVIDKTFDTAWVMMHGPETIGAKHYGPAHTGGDIVVVFPNANVAHMGDLSFNRLHPVIDRVNGASIANWSVVLRKVTSELPADTIYIHGHAGTGFEVIGPKADLLHHANYLEALLEYVRAQVKAGKTREEVIALREVIKGFEDYGPLIARPLGPAFDEVTAAVGRL